MDDIKLTPLNFIYQIKKSDPHLVRLYTRGSCYQFSLLLHSFFPEGKIYMRQDKKHTALMIHDVLYDINGISPPDSYHPLTKEERLKCEKWSSERNLVLLEKKMFKEIQKKLNQYNLLLWIIYTLLQLFLLMGIGLFFTYIDEIANTDFKWFLLLIILISLYWLHTLKKPLKYK